jgi:hypothetical protein
VVGYEGTVYKIDFSEANFDEAGEDNNGKSGRHSN